MEVGETSLTFGNTGDEVNLAFCAGDGDDISGYGLLGSICHFITQAAGIKQGDTERILKARLWMGDPHYRYVHRNRRALAVKWPIRVCCAGTPTSCFT